MIKIKKLRTHETFTIQRLMTSWYENWPLKFIQLIIINLKKYC
jgi:hypothetical protein